MSRLSGETPQCRDGAECAAWVGRSVLVVRITCQRLCQVLPEDCVHIDLFEDFCRKYVRELNRLRMEHRAGLSSARSELASVEREIRKPVQAIKDGVSALSINDELLSRAQGNRLGAMAHEILPDELSALLAPAQSIAANLRRVVLALVFASASRRFVLRNLRVAVTSILITSLGPACVPFVATCTWVELTGADLRLVSLRQPERGECGTAGRKAPGVYRLDRAAYTLEFWNGNRWYPELGLRARAHGRRVSLRSANLREIHDQPVRAWADWDYMLDAPGHIEGGDVGSAWPSELSIEIVSVDGAHLGTERIGLKLNSCRYLAIEGP